MPDGHLQSGPHELFDLWIKGYEAMVGRMAMTPALGPTRERVEQYMKSVSNYVDLYSAWLESFVDFETVFAEASRRTQQNFALQMEEDVELDLQGKEKPETYQDFYKVWVATYSDTFREFLKSKEFSMDMAKFLDQSVDFQMGAKALLEENFLKPANLPTKTEVVEMEREIYQLKREVRALSRQIAEMNDGKKNGGE